MYRTAHTYGTYPIDVEKIRARRRAIHGKLSTRLRPQQARGVA